MAYYEHVSALLYAEKEGVTPEKMNTHVFNEWYSLVEDMPNPLFPSYEKAVELDEKYSGSLEEWDQDNLAADIQQLKELEEALSEIEL